MLRMFLLSWISMFISSTTCGGTPLWATKAQFSTEPNWAFLDGGFLVYFPLTDALHGWMYFFLYESKVSDPLEAEREAEVPFRRQEVLRMRLRTPAVVACNAHLLHRHPNNGIVHRGQLVGV